MYLWDTNILRHYGENHPVLEQHLSRVPLDQVAIPSVAFAEALRGRVEFVLKATPQQAPFANQYLMDTLDLMQEFKILVFDDAAAKEMIKLTRKIKKRKKRHADIMIAAMALAGKHIVVTRNLRHFADLLPARQLVNWIDNPPT